MNLVAKELQRTYFKSKSLRKFNYCNCTSFSCIADPLQSAQIHENATKITLDLSKGVGSTSIFSPKKIQISRFYESIYEFREIHYCFYLREI